MNIWLKRVSLVLPPAIVAGVYFNKIPIGPEFREKVEPEKIENMVPQKEVFPIVEKLRGEVYVKDLASFPPVLLKGGEILKEGQSLATGPHSDVLLTYRGYHSWILRIYPDAQINIDELLNGKDKQTTVVNLMRGGIILRVKNNSGASGNVLVRTKFASFVVSNGTVAILTDGENQSLMSVQAGSGEAENLKTMDKTPVRAGHNYLVNREGEKKVQLDLDALDLFDWEPTNLTSTLPTMEKVTDLVGSLGPTLDDQAKAKLEALKKIDEVILAFKKENEILKRELAILLENAEQSRIGLRKERVVVEKDIKCLQTNEFECNLFSEKILLMRGFTKMWGNPQYRDSLVVSLGKYLQERNEEVQRREDEAKISARLMTAREAVLRAVEADRAAEKNLEKLIPSLQDERLRR